MSILNFKNKLGDHAKDIKINLINIFSDETSNNISLKQTYIIALASAYAVKNEQLCESLVNENVLSEVEINAAKIAATLMAMNNVYYRFTHLVNDKTFATMPAKLRMTMLANHGIDKIDFELACLAVSAINGCGMCMEAHTGELIKAGVSKLAIQSSIRMAAIMNATVVALV